MKAQKKKQTRNQKATATAVVKKKERKPPAATTKTNLDLLLSLDDDLSSSSSAPLNPSHSIVTPTLAGMLTPTASSSSAAALSGSLMQDASPMFVPIHETELLSKMTSNGLQVSYRYVLNNKSLVSDM